MSTLRALINHTGVLSPNLSNKQIKYLFKPRITMVAAGYIPFIYIKVILVTIPPAVSAFLFARLAVRTGCWLVACYRAARAWIVRAARLAHALTRHLSMPTLLILLGRIYVRLVIAAMIALWGRMTRGSKCASAANLLVRRALAVLWAFGLWGPLHRAPNKGESLQPNNKRNRRSI